MVPSPSPTSPPAHAPLPPTAMPPVGDQALGAASSGFFDTVRSESIKVRTVRSFWLMVGLAVAFPIVVTALTALLADSPFNGADFLDAIAGLCVLPAMILGAFAVTTLTAEYTHQTIRVTYAATPNRLRVHLAKLSVVATLAAAAVFAAYFVCWTIAKVSEPNAQSITSSEGLTSWIATAVMAALIVVFGYAIGLNLRNSAASVTLLLLWPLLIENLVAGLLYLVGAEDAYRWLPYSSMLSATTSVVTSDSGTSLGRPGAELWFLAVSGALWALGMVRESRRDA